MTTQATTTDIFYPESDGMPMPDGLTQAPLYIRIVGTLRTFFRNIGDCEVNGDVFIYYVEGDNRRSVSPDCFVVFGLSEDALESLSERNTYLLWEVGKPPDFILEIGSPSTGNVDTGRKRELYAELGVGEYWRYDGTGGEFYGEALVGERLVDGEYERMEMRHEVQGDVWSHSDALNLDLWWRDGELRFWDPVAGEWLLTQDEEQDGRLDAEARAAAEHGGRLDAEARATAERDGRLDAEARATAERGGRLAEREARLAAEERIAQLEEEMRRMQRG